jgi:Holliday junction resolvase-like predicted endonuclease
LFLCRNVIRETFEINQKVIHETLYKKIKIMNNKDVGKKGEDIACKILLKHGFEILARNYTRKIGEIDIIASKKGIIHFIEVKTVSRETFEIDEKVIHETLGDVFKPEDNVDQRKLHKISKVSDLFIKEFHLNNKMFQIDVFVVYLLKNQYRNREQSYIFNYIPNANL